jgi:hypothetical protein
MAVLPLIGYCADLSPGSALLFLGFAVQFVSTPSRFDGRTLRALLTMRAEPLPGQ